MERCATVIKYLSQRLNFGFELPFCTSISLILHNIDFICHTPKELMFATCKVALWRNKVSEGFLSIFCKLSFTTFKTIAEACFWMQLQKEEQNTKD